ncbi:unnamed protein product [Candida verbasci]|uniref:TLDc domain-containing protein n=1 Tax=Candida verbasci TaxID=1227364 RepID=A0A9W4TRM2_9ASCO|nr:unnamed protein product [Candida verbasci]
MELKYTDNDINGTTNNNEPVDEEEQAVMNETGLIEPTKDTAQLTNDEVYKLFYTRCILLLKPIELTFLKDKINDKEQSSFKPLEFAKLLRIIPETHVDSILNKDLESSIELLFKVAKVIGSFPFLKVPNHEDLQFEELVIFLIIMSGRYKVMFKQEINYLRLLFITLSYSTSEIEENKTNADSENDKESKITTTSNLENEKQEIVSSSVEVKFKIPVEKDDNLEIQCRKIDWYDVYERFVSNIQVDNVTINAKLLQNLLCLFLIINSVPKQTHDQKVFHDRINKWDEFEPYSSYILKYLNVNLPLKNLETESTNYEEFEQGMNNLLPQFFQQNFSKLISFSFMQNIKPKSIISESFQESRLVNIAFISYLSSISKGLNIQVEISESNLVKLFSGSETGFSIRTLETKIFKWQAPTLFIVSGKRIKSKTLSNRRYIDFDESYPRFFKSSELRPWQNEKDRITYAVFVNSPWKNSNKYNFGDEKTTIIQIQPRADVYTSIHSDVLKGESIYFNNLGMGLGFGNDQPLNKNKVKKYHPGDVSLTIESNLEFAIFRHLVNNNELSYFNRCKILNEDFEDRFTITDLEVFGLGTTKELEEQKKQWEWEEKQAEARQNVNMRSLGEERAFLEMVGLVGKNNAGGSM